MQPNFAPTQDVIDATFDLLASSGTPVSNFRAAMILVRQIRNNLFHGMKMELGDRAAYQRNKELIIHARDLLDVIIGHLERAEAACLPT